MCLVGGLNGAFLAWYARAMEVRRHLLVTLLLGAALASGCAGEKAEGRPWVHDVRFIGVKSVSKRDLRSRISIQLTHWYSPFRKKFLDPFALPGDRERIEAYYRAHGYFDARVVKANVFPHKKGSVDVEFRIDEGPPTKVSRVVVQGVEDSIKDRRQQEAIWRMPMLVQGKIFKHDDYISEKQLMRQRLKLRGYAWPKVRGEVAIDRDALTAAITLAVTAGPLAHIGKIEVVGNDKVRVNDILRTADLTTGRRFSPDDLENARGRVYNAGVFSSVRITYVHDPVDPSIANVKIEVQESAFRELRVGGGLSIEAQRNDLHLFAQYTKRNFFGGMRSLRLRLEPAIVAVPAVWNPVRVGPALTAEAEFKQPFLFGLRHFDLRWVVGYDLGIDYFFQYHGPRTTLGVNYGLWRNRVNFGLSYNIQYLFFFQTASTVLENPEQAGSLFGYVNPYRVGWWQEDISLDLRDDPLEPHYGAYFQISAEQGGVFAGGAFQYEKIVPDARVYAPLGNRVTLAARAQFGQIWSQGDLGSPTTRRLYLGGPNSHRGFTYNRLSYQVAQGASSNLPPFPIGGDQSLLLQGELRVRVVKLFGNWLGFVAFADGGDVTMPSCRGDCVVSATGPDAPAQPNKTNTLSSLQMSQLHWAVGGGLRYATIIGTIRLDVGVRLNRLQDGALLTPDPGSRIAYHISVGEAF